MFPSTALPLTVDRESHIRAPQESGRTGHQPAFAALVPGVRWAILAIAAFIAAVHGPIDRSVVVLGGVLVAHAAWRGTHRDRGHGRRRLVDRYVAAPLAIMVEVFITVLAIDTTGYWGSPFAFCLLSVVVAAGFAQGFGLGVRVAGVAVLCVGIPGHLEQANFAIESLGLSGQWALELVLVAILAGYARRLFGEAEERHEQALDRVSQLAEANDLLVSLHRVAQSLPASLNLDQVAKSTIERLRSLIDCDVTALLLRDDVTGRWIVAASEGAVSPGPWPTRTSPRPCGPPPAAASPPWWSAWPRARASAPPSSPGRASTPPSGPGARWSASSPSSTTIPATTAAGSSSSSTAS